MPCKLYMLIWQFEFSVRIRKSCNHLPMNSQHVSKAQRYRCFFTNKEISNRAFAAARMKKNINRKCLILWQFDSGAFVCTMEWHETWRLFNWYGVHLMRLFTTWGVQYLSVYKRPHKIYFNLNLITASGFLLFLISTSGSSLLLSHPMNIQNFYEPHNSVLHEIFSWQKDTCYSIHKMEKRKNTQIKQKCERKIFSKLYRNRNENYVVPSKQTTYQNSHWIMTTTITASKKCSLFREFISVRFIIFAFILLHNKCQRLEKEQCMYILLLDLVWFSLLLCSFWWNRMYCTHEIRTRAKRTSTPKS